MEGQSTIHPTNNKNPQNCQGHKKQGKSEKLSERSLRNMTTKYHVVSWMGYWNRQRVLGKNRGNLNKWIF